METAQTVGVAVALFAATNVDDLFLLLACFADRRLRPDAIVMGQYLGIAALVAASLAASLVSLVLPAPWVGLLGLVPLALGVAGLHRLWRNRGAILVDESPSASGRLGTLLAVAGVTVANGSDNVAVYTPVFATQSLSELTVTLAVFATLVGAWILAARWLVAHPAAGATIRRHAPTLVPFIFVALGLWVLTTAGSLTLLG